MNSPLHKIMGTAEAAEIMGVHQDTVKRLCREGKINAKKIGKEWVIEKIEKVEPNESLNKKKYIKSPLNYTGGKYKLLNQILPLFPKEINTFYDLFCGGCNVGVNVSARKIVCNDNINYLIELFSIFKDKEIDFILEHIYSRIQEFNLSKTNQEGYNDFRAFYNKEKNPLDLYVLICYSFNHQIRFNNDHLFNAPFGRNRSHFSEQLQEKLVAFISEIKNKSMSFTNYDFTNTNFDYDKDDFVYCDPPYLISSGVYNDGKRGFEGWNKTHEKKLLHYLDELNKKGVKFALSNLLENKGLKNEILIEWAGNYNIHPINSNYSNSNYQRKDKNLENSKEVLITNY